MNSPANGLGKYLHEGKFVAFVEAMQSLKHLKSLHLSGKCVLG